MPQDSAVEALKTPGFSTESVPQVLLLKDLARLSGHSIHTLKYYLKLGLIHETGRSSETRFRYFSQQTLEQLRVIRQLQKEGRKLAEIKQVMGNG